jgi:heme exporter protein D
MYLQTTDLLAIMIALVCSCVVMVVSVNAHRNLLRVNKELIKTIRILQSKEDYIETFKARNQ